MKKQIGDFIATIDNELCEINATLVGEINSCTDIDKTIELIELYNIVDPLYKAVYEINEKFPV